MLLISDNEDLARSRRRASHSELKEHFDSFGLENETAHLPFGDVAFQGNGPDGALSVGIELKTIQDFIGSMRSGRLLGHQVPGMKEMYDRQYVFIEGIFRFGRKSGLLEVPTGQAWRSPNLGPQPIFWTSIQAFAVGLEEAGLRLHWTRTPFETAKEIEVLYRWWNKDYEEHTTLLPALKQQGVPMIGTQRPNQKWKTAAGLPGIGWGRGRKVAEHFRSIQAMTNAPEAEWERIEGIGRTIAHNVYTALTQETTGAVTDDSSRRATHTQLQTRPRAALRGHRRSRGSPSAGSGSGSRCSRLSKVARRH